MCFESKCMNNFRVPDLFIGGALLDRVSTYKYLDVIIDEQYCDHEDIQRQTRCIYARCNVLIKKFSACTNDVKARLLKSYCRTPYCSQLWCSYNSASFTKL